MDKPILNGSSLSHLTGATTKKVVQVEISYPASSMAEVIDAIHKLGKTGKLQLNFSNGKAQNLTWANTVKSDVDSTG